MIYCSLDLREDHFCEILDSLDDIKRSRFGGIELCLWEDLLPKVDQLRSAIQQQGLRVNVHADLMRSNEGIVACEQKLKYSLDFFQRVGGDTLVSHPIKPYSQNLALSKDLFTRLQVPAAIETIRGVSIQEICQFNRPIVADVGNIAINGEKVDACPNELVRLVHIHDFIGSTDHFPLGSGELDLEEVTKKFKNIDFTIELSPNFRTWGSLREDYRKSIDILNNQLISNDSYGKNVRLRHLGEYVHNRIFKKAIEIGCGEGFLLHNTNALNKIGYDLIPNKKFNDINYIKSDVMDLPADDADLIICSEVIEHISDDTRAIKKLVDSTKSGGLIYLTTINKNVFVDKSNQDLKRGHLRRYGPELRAILEKAGFNTIEFYPFRGSHYYEQKDFKNYDLQKDKETSKAHASGWVYVGQRV